MRSLRRLPAHLAMRDAGPLNARIQAWLKAEILTLALEPGAAIVEADIAERFESSRTPVREALLHLADEGLVEIRPQRGTYVARLALPRIESAMFIRQAIECAVTRRLVTDEHRLATCAKLRSIVQRHEDALVARDIERALQCDTEFHRVLVEASGLPGVWEVVAQAREMHQRIRAIAVPKLGTGKQAVADHRSIVSALQRSDSAAAERAVTRHLARNVALAREIALLQPSYFDKSGGEVDEYGRTRGTRQTRGH